MKVVGDLRELAGEHTSQALAVLVEVMSDKAAVAAARVAAAGHVLDRGFGKPAANLDTQLTVNLSVSSQAAAVLLE